MVLETFLKASAQVLNIDTELTLKHVFSVEKDENKRRFLQDFFNMEELYTDALVPVSRSVSICSAGFPCDDASALHPNSSSDAHRLCVAEETQRAFDLHFS